MAAKRGFRKRQRRLIMLGLVLPALFAAVGLTLYGLRSSTVYFYAPSDLPNAQELAERTIRLGGMVVKDSVVQGEGTLVSFLVTDFEETVLVTFDGLLPGLFADEEGVVAQGKLLADGTFKAERVLAKHDEKYMPPEVAESLKGDYGEYQRQRKED